MVMDDGSSITIDVRFICCEFDSKLFSSRRTITVIHITIKKRKRSMKYFEDYNTVVVNNESGKDFELTESHA